MEKKFQMSLFQYIFAKIYHYYSTGIFIIHSFTNGYKWIALIQADYMQQNKKDVNYRWRHV